MYYEPLAFWTLGLVALTCLFSFRGFQSQSFEDRFIFWPERILADKQGYRIVTSGFLHANGRHLLFNMISLYLFADDIELFFGPKTVLGIYFGSLVGGSLLSLFLHRHHEYRALGASGAVCGIMFAHIFLLPGGEISSFFCPIGIPSWLYAVLFLVVSFFAMKRNQDNIGHDAHLGGRSLVLF